MATANAMFTITDVGDLNGRNLVLNSHEEHSITVSGSGATGVVPYYSYSDFASEFTHRKGQILTVSFDYETAGNTLSTGYIYAQHNESQIATTAGNCLVYILDNPSGHYSKTFQVTTNQSTSAKNTIRVIYKTCSPGTVIKIKNIKVEIGDTATDWTPAPEDVSTALDDAKEAQSTADNAQTAASNAQTDATYAKNEIDGLEVGGRNILKHSEQPYGIIRSYGSSVIHTESNIDVNEWATNSGVRYYGNAGTSVIFGLIGGNTYYIAQKDLHYLNRPYTLSAYVKNLSETSRLCFKVNGTELAEAVEIAPLEQKRVVYVYSKPSTAFLVQLTLYVDNAGDSFDFVMWHPQIEYGTRATDWTPAPEDVEESINSKNSVYYQATAPTGNLKDGDTWFDTSKDYKISRWNSGTQEWIAAELGNQAVGNLDASHINTGTLTAVHIESGKAQDIAGTIKVYDENDDIKVRLDKDGLMATKGIVGGWNIGENTLESDHVSGVDESGVEHTGKSILDVEGGLEIVGSSTTKYTPDIYQRDWGHPSVSLWGESHIGPRSISSEYLVANDKSIAKGGFWIPGRNISAWYTLTPRKQIANTGMYFTLYTKGDLSLFWLVLDGKTPEWTAGVKNNVATSLVDYVDSPTAHFIHSIERERVAPPCTIWIINSRGSGSSSGKGGICNNYGQEIQPYISMEGYINIYAACTNTSVAPITADVFWAHIDYPYTES